MGILKAPVATASSLEYESAVRPFHRTQRKTKSSLPAADPTCEDFDDNLAILGVSPRDGDLLKVTALLEEGVGGVGIGVRKS